MKKEFVTQLIILIVELMFSRIRVGDTSFHLLSAERFANSSDSKGIDTIQRIKTINCQPTTINQNPYICS